MMAARLLVTRTIARRSFAAVVQPKLEENLVHATIQKMLNAAESQTRTDLLRSATFFESRLEEARQCVADCQNGEGNLKEEYETADAALEEATAALVDLIDDLRTSDEDVSLRYKLLRENSAASIKTLRYALDEILAKLPEVEREMST